MQDTSAVPCRAVPPYHFVCALASDQRVGCAHCPIQQHPNPHVHHIRLRLPLPPKPQLCIGTALNLKDMDRGLAQKRLGDAHDRLNGSVVGILADRHHLSLTTTDSRPHLTTHFTPYRVPTSPPQPFASTPWLPHPPRYPPLSVLHPQPSPHTSCLERMKPAPRTPSSASPSSATRYGKKHPLLVPLNLRRLLPFLPLRAMLRNATRSNE